MRGARLGRQCYAVDAALRRTALRAVRRLTTGAAQGHRSGGAFSVLPPFPPRGHCLRLASPVGDQGRAESGGEAGHVGRMSGAIVATVVAVATAVVAAAAAVLMALGPHAESPLPPDFPRAGVPGLPAPGLPCAGDGGAPLPFAGTGAGGLAPAFAGGGFTGFAGAFAGAIFACVGFAQQPQHLNSSVMSCRTKKNTGSTESRTSTISSNSNWSTKGVATAIACS